MRERRKLKRVLMGRLLIFLFAIAIQFIWLVWLMYHFSNLTYFLPLIEVLSLIVLFIIINRKINSAYKLIWAVLVLAFPLVGLNSIWFLGIIGGILLLEKDYQKPMAVLSRNFLKTMKCLQN
ncbi:PLD nuclease N-terminal domain-containing protein [Lactococcus taiwanensis]|uniref:PLD nuclease N-terminal domain-containing protein n=1 Tax=Lactococcus taiwanensis TaxID=1151742 RepID=UPI0028B083FD|nr:PLD nuclease N-terminal domain-containing protein [Lactococcus taiwanensis]